MRRLQTAGPITAVAVLLLSTGIALASSQFKQTSNIRLTATKAGAATGFKAALKSSDPGEPGGKPQALKTLKITFPVGTKFNFKSKAIKPCTATVTLFAAIFPCSTSTDPAAAFGVSSKIRSLLLA